VSRAPPENTLRALARVTYRTGCPDRTAYSRMAFSCKAIRPRCVIVGKCLTSNAPSLEGEGLGTAPCRPATTVYLKYTPASRNVQTFVRARRSKGMMKTIQALANRPGVHSDAVINFLSSLEGMSYQEAVANCEMDARSYRWNLETSGAIREGLIKYYFGGENG
jgi:hypothetical protein